MTRKELLLIQLAEECNEVAQRCAKALRFGLDDIQTNHPDGQKLNNAQRIQQELDDLQALVYMLKDERAIPTAYNPEHIRKKYEKVEKFLEYSRQCGTLTEPD